MSSVRVWIWVSCSILLGCSSDTSSPATSHQAPDFTGIATASTPDTPEALAAKRKKLESHLRQAREAEERGQLDPAIKLLEEAVVFDPQHRTVLLLLTQCLQKRSKQLAASDPGRAYGLMVQSGGYLRALRHAHRDFTTEENRIIANILFDEMCAHARSNRHEETIGSLQAAIDAGFDDLERLQTDPDVAPIRKHPVMAAAFEEAAERMMQARETQPPAENVPDPSAGTEPARDSK